MERKLVKQGKSALTITLPHMWLEKRNLKQGDYINIKEEKNYLKLETEKNKTNSIKEIDVCDLNKGLAFHLLIGAYIQGYDTIKIKHNNYNLSQKLANFLVGMIVEKHTEDILIITDLIKIPQEQFMTIFKRSCQLLIQQARLLKQIIEKKASFEDLKKEENLLDQNVFYCLRYINKYEKIENSYKYFLLTTTIESVGDLISEIGKESSLNNLNKEIKIIDSIIETIEYYIVYLFENNLTKLYNLIQNFKKNTPTNSYISGIAFCIGENLYNYIGYLTIEKNNKLIK